MARPPRRLPDDTLPRLRAILEDSVPNKDRPQLDPEREKRLENTERRSAACYASMEDTTARLIKIAHDLEDSITSKGE